MAEGKRHAGEGIANLETARVLAENQEDVLRKWEARIRDHFTGIQLAEVAPAETISADIAAVFQRLLDRLRGNQSPQEYASFHHWIYDGGQYGIELSDITHVLQSLKKAAREAIRETVDDFSRAMQMELQIGEAVDGMVLRAGELFQVARREDMRVMRARFEQISDAWEVEETLTRAETSDEVFRLACEKLEEFFPVSGCLVRLYEGKNKSKAEVSAGIELCSIEELPVPMAVGRPQYLTKEEMDSRGAIDLLELSRRRGEVIVRDVTAGSGLEADQMTLFGPRVSAELVNGDELWRVGIKSVACVPLMAIDRVVGVLLIATGEEKAFPEERHAMLEDLGDVLGPAFARVAHMEQSRREMTEAEVIARIGRVLLEVPTLEFLLLAVVEALQQFRDYWHASVFRVETLQGEDGPRQECVLMSEAGPGKGRWTEDRRIHFGEGVVGQAAQKGQQIVKSGKNADMDIVVEKDERRVVSPGTSVEAVPEASENFSEIAVPIKRGDTVIGIFDCVSREPHAFQEGERSALQNLSTHIGLGLQNVELLQQQRRTRRELERVHSQLSSIVRNTAVGITGLDNQGIFTHWSPSCEKLLGYKEEEIVGKRKLSDLSAEAVDMEELLENCTKQGDISREVVLLHKDGTPLIVQEMMEPMVDENGERVGFTASLLDVTEKRQHEEAIRRERNNLNLVVEAMGAGLALFDRDCRLNWANKTLLDWFNCAGEDGEPENRMPCGQVFGCSQSSPAEAEAGCDSSCPLADAVETGELETGLIERVDPDGVWHCYMQVARPVEFGQSQFLVLTLDVTERRRQTEQVQLINRLTRALEHTPAVSASEEGTLSLDLDQIYHLILTCVTAGHALGFNRAFIFTPDSGGKKLLGRAAVGPTSAEDANRIWQQVSRESRSLEELLAVSEPSESDIALSEKARQIEVPVKNTSCVLAKVFYDQSPRIVEQQGNGSRVYPALRETLQLEEFVAVPLIARDRSVGVMLADNKYSGTPIDENSRELLRMFAAQAALAITNIRAYRKIRNQVAELRKTQSKLIEAESLASVGRMASHLAHEIRNPLTTIGGFAKAIQRATEKGDITHRNSTVIYNEVMRLEAALEDVLDFVRPVGPERKPADLNSLVEETVLQFRAELEDNGVDVRLSLGEELPMVLMDPSLIKQVIINLLKNSIDALENASRKILRIQTRVARPTDYQGKVALRISDTGVGMDEDTRETVFAPFFTTKVAGTGLGLAISKKIITEHSGDIAVESELGEGSRFTVFLEAVGDDTAGQEGA